MILPWARDLQDRSPRSESICPVERPSSCDTGHKAWLTMKGSVQQSPVNQPVYSEHAPVTRIILGSPSSTVTPGESVRPVHTGQKAQLEKTDQCLAQSELPVLNSPVTSVQLELNVHEPLGNMPTLQIEHLSEHSQVFQEQMILLYELICKILDIGLWATVTPSTLWAPVTLITVQTVSIQSTDLGRSGLMLLRMGQTELDIVLMSLVLHGEIVSHIMYLFLSVTLTQMNSLQL